MVEFIDQSEFSVLGKLAWLWMSSRLHRGWSNELLCQFLLPPIAKGQYHLIERDGLPVAYCSWALLSEASELEYMADPARLKLENWNDGDRLWFVDWVAPFSSRDTWELKRLIGQKFPDQVARAIRVKPSSERARIMEFHGKKINPTDAGRLLNEYYEQFLARVTKVPARLM